MPLHHIVRHQVSDTEWDLIRRAQGRLLETQLYVDDTSQASLAHIVKASEEDLLWLYPGRSVDESLKAWAAMGPRFCVATLGERGALAMLGSDRIAVPAPRIEVADTVGAGDSFMSALLSAMDRDAALGAGSKAPGRADLERWLRFAASASAITCTRRGSDPPTLGEVELALGAVERGR